MTSSRRRAVTDLIGTRSGTMEETAPACPAVGYVQGCRNVYYGTWEEGELTPVMPWVLVWLIVVTFVALYRGRRWS